MRRHICWWAAPIALVVSGAISGCDDGRSRVEPGEQGRPDLGVMLDAEPLADATVLDAGLAPDLALDDLGLDAAIDAGPDAEVDAASDPDLALDAEPDLAPDLALDAEVPPLDFDLPDGGVVGRFVVGEARAADDRATVVAQAGEVLARAEPDGRFRIGPLDDELIGGEVVLRFSADAHHSESVSLAVDAGDGVTALPDPVLLYRGIRIGPAADGRTLFRFDDAWFLWSVGDTLLGTRTDEIEVQTLIEDRFEVFLGFDISGEWAHVRRRTMPGVAGDIERIALDGALAARLFVEAQPWVREVGGWLIAMTQTREALSRLVATRSDGAVSRTLDEGVPWLLVTTLDDGRIAWAAGEPPGFGVYVGAVDAGDAVEVSPPEGPTTDAFLLTTPDRAGLVWISPDATLWRWPGDGPAEAIADEVLADPRPRLLRDDRVVFMRADGAEVSVHVAGPDGEIELIDGAARSSGTLIGETLYVERPGRGLWAGELSGEGWGPVLDAPIDALMSSGGGVLALIDGVAWRYRPDIGAERLGGAGLSQLGFAPLGATAWQADEGAVWFLPAPGVEGEPTPLVEGAPRLGRVNAPGGQTIYLLGAEGWRSVPLPPGDGVTPIFERAVDVLYPLDEAALLATDADDALWAIDPATGEAVGWARAVSRVERSPRRGYVAYVCDRGTFLVPLAE